MDTTRMQVERPEASMDVDSPSHVPWSSDTRNRGKQEEEERSSVSLSSASSSTDEEGEEDEGSDKALVHKSSS